LLYSLLPLLISVFFNIHLFFSNQKTPSKKELPNIFTSIASSDKPTQLVVGDKQMYREYDPQMDKVRYICDNELDLGDNRLFSAIIKKYAERSIRLSASTHTDIAMYRFAETIRSNYDFRIQPNEIKLSSELKEVNSNIIFFGKFGKFDLNILSNYFNKSSFNQTFEHPSDLIKELVKKGEVKQEVYQRQQLRGTRGTFLYIVKTTFEGIEMLFFLNSSRISKDYMYKKILMGSFSEEVKEKFNHTFPTKYELLIEVSGRDVGTSHEIIYAKELD